MKGYTFDSDTIKLGKKLASNEWRDFLKFLFLAEKIGFNRNREKIDQAVFN